MMMSSTNVKLRPYESKDYDRVILLFKRGMYENWWPLYKKTITFQSTHATLLQILQLILLFYILELKIFIITEIFLQALLMGLCFYMYYEYVW